MNDFTTCTVVGVEFFILEFSDKIHEFRNYEVYLFVSFTIVSNGSIVKNKLK